MSALSCALLFVYLLLIAHDAQAYLDPGTGSFIFQLLLGGALGGIIAIKLKFKQFKNFFSSKLPKKENKTRTNPKTNTEHAQN